MTEPKVAGAEASSNGTHPERQRAYFSSPAPSPTRTAKRSEVLASKIVEEIVDRELQPGDMLPSEASMLEHYGVGRASLREALRLLEAQGLVTLKPGPGGGPVVGTVDPDNLGRTASLYFRLAGASYQVLAEAMQVMEPWLAELAARRSSLLATVDTTLDDCIAASEEARGDSLGVWRTAPEFHEAMYKLSGNPVLETVACALGAIFRGQVLNQVDLAPHQERFLESHRRLAAAITAGQPTKARRLAFEHVGDMTDVVRQQAPTLFDKSIEWR